MKKTLQIFSYQTKPPPSVSPSCTLLLLFTSLHDEILSSVRGRGWQRPCPLRSSAPPAPDANNQPYSTCSAQFNPEFRIRVDFEQDPTLKKTRNRPSAVTGPICFISLNLRLNTAQYIFLSAMATDLRWDLDPETGVQTLNVFGFDPSESRS